MCKPIVLNLGCSNQSIPSCIFAQIYPDGFEEMRVDIDPYCRHNVTANIQHLPFIDQCADAVFANHVLEHFDSRERWPVLHEWKRVVKHNGLMYITVPSLNNKILLDILAKGNIDETLYTSAAGKITATQLIYGQFYPGPYEIHRWGYTPQTLVAFLNNFLDQVVYAEESFQATCYGWVRHKFSIDVGRR